MPDYAPKGTEAIEVRVVRLTHPSGEESYYITSLRRTHFFRTDIAALYRKRWEAEELFKLEKSSYFGQHQFHARQPNGIKQEILAQAIFVILAWFPWSPSSRPFVPGPPRPAHSHEMSGVHQLYGWKWMKKRMERVCAGLSTW